MNTPRTVIDAGLTVEHGGYRMSLTSPEGLIIVRFQSLRGMLHFLPAWRRVWPFLPRGVPFQIALRRFRIPFQLTT